MYPSSEMVNSCETPHQIWRSITRGIVHSRTSIGQLYIGFSGLWLRRTGMSSTAHTTWVATCFLDQVCLLWFGAILRCAQQSARNLILWPIQSRIPFAPYRCRFQTSMAWLQVSNHSHLKCVTCRLAFGHIYNVLQTHGIVSHHLLWIITALYVYVPHFLGIIYWSLTSLLVIQSPLQDTWMSRSRK
jgi:hypothetical protein